MAATTAPSALPGPPSLASALGEAALRRGLLADAPAAALVRRLLTAGADDARAIRAALPAGDEGDALRRLMPPDGARFGDFRLLALLADDSDSLVWLAERAGRLAVVKQLRPELGVALAYEKRFLRECEVLAGLEHPHVVRHLGHGRVADGLPWVALDYVPGGGLDGVLRRRGRLGEAEALRLCAQVALALDALHQRGLVHRALKPGNILLGEDGIARLADFGLACAVPEQGALTLQGTVVGTPAWLSPERVRGDDCDIRADVYALGCVLFACLAGSAPFTGDRDRVLRQHLGAPAPDVRRAVAAIGEGTAKIILKCLAKDPADRYAEPLALHASLRRELARLGGDGHARVDGADPSAGQATLRAAPPAAFAPGEPLALDWLTLVEAEGGEDNLVLLLARPELVLGSRCGEGTDLCLRVYPVEHHDEACRRISRAHLALRVGPAGVAAVDLGSTNGTLLGGQRLVQGVSTPLPLGTQPLDIPDALGLDVAVTARGAAPLPGQPAGGPDAVVLTRRANRTRLAYALVRRTLTVGGPGADLALVGHRAPSSIAIARASGGWWWRAGDSGDWLPVIAGGVLASGGLRLLARAGDAADFA